MRAAALRFEIHIPHSQSLKEKRAILRPLVDGLRRMLSVSVSEVAHQNTWQRTTIGVALVAPDGGRLDELIERVQRYFEGQLEIDLVGIEVYHIEEAP